MIVTAVEYIYIYVWMAIAKLGAYVVALEAEPKFTFALDSTHLEYVFFFSSVVIFNFWENEMKANVWATLNA